MERIDESKLGVQLTTMAIRERLMEYFKGTCVEQFTENSNIRIRSRIRDGSASYQYLRREQENRQPSVLLLGELPILTLQKAPEQAVFNTRLLTRSPQLREINKELKDFMQKYLSGVEVKHSRKGVIYAT